LAALATGALVADATFGMALDNDAAGAEKVGPAAPTGSAGPL
jgi:hypothetical protein